MLKMPRDDHGHAFMAMGQGERQIVALGGASAASAPIAADVPGREAVLVRLCATADCWIQFGPVPVAAEDETSSFLPAGAIEHWMIVPGHKVAAIAADEAGVLSITEALR